jgi:hypothetical protein
VNFLTSAPSLGGEELEFTDLVLLRLHGLIGLGDSAELFVGTDVLPKQPSYTDELAWQGSLLGVRAKLDKNFSAWARASGGPMLGREGYWVSGDAAVSYRMALEKFIFFESSLGWTHTQLFFDRDTEDPFYVEEVFTKWGLALRDRKGRLGAWLSFDYVYPVVSDPDLGAPDPVSGGALDPQPRVNFHLGTIVGISKTVSLFVEWSILDRGDLENPFTTLPFLNTGFDQRQLLFGFIRRFGNKPLPRPKAPPPPPPVDIAK